MVFTPRGLFGKELFGTWIVAYCRAYLLGSIVQYFTIVPMRGLSVGTGLWAAVKADTFSLTAYPANWLLLKLGWKEPMSRPPPRSFAIAPSRRGRRAFYDVAEGLVQVPGAWPV